MAKRPRSEVQSVIIYKKSRVDADWVPHKIERDSWVTLTAPKRGLWAKDGRKAEVCAMDGHFKAQVKAFKFRPNSSTVDKILVAHAYSFRQLELENKVKEAGKPVGEVNYLYPTKWEDWQDPQTIASVIVVKHAIIGELTRGGRTHKQLLEAGIFFSNASYSPPSCPGKFGQLSPLPLPALDDVFWPVPDMHTSESFRARLFSDFQVSMKPKTGSRVTNIHWFMPIHVMVDLFSIHCGAGMHRTPTMWVFRPISEDLFASLMDLGWDTKIVAGEDIIKCEVIHSSVSFRYHVGRETLYTLFHYVRKRLVGSNWTELDQSNGVEMVKIQVHLLDGTWQAFEVGRTWLLCHLRDEVTFYCATEEFSFVIVGSGNIRDKKVNRRQERTMTIDDIGQNKTLRMWGGVQGE